MKIPQVTLVHNRRKHDGKSCIEIRITHNRKQYYISTGIFVEKSEWKNGRIVDRNDALNLNKTLDKIVFSLRSFILDHISEEETDIRSILQKYNRVKDNENFIAFCRRRAEVRKYGNTKDSQERYDRFIRMFTSWAGITDYKDINESNIIAYDRYLKKKGLKDYSKWNNYHRFLNSFIMDAMDEGLLQKNPYKWININKGEKVSTSRYLTPEEFERIVKCDMPTPSLKRTKDIFIFQTYTCLSYSDLKNLNAADIKEIDGMKVYIGRRKKTNRRFTIPIVKPALEILEKYDYKLPVISNVKYNEYLKKIAALSGIEKSLSTHWARHTGATLLLNEGVDINIIAKICGHSSIRITEQVYAKVLDETVVKVIKSLNK